MKLNAACKDRPWVVRCGESKRVNFFFDKTSSLRFLFLDSQTYLQAKLSKVNTKRIMNSDETKRMLKEVVMAYLKGICANFVLGTE
jgi:hypothetical protein